MSLKLVVTLVFTLAVCNVNPLNILGIFEFPSKSLHILGHELLLGLAKRGHNVTLMSAFPLEKQFPNYTHVYLDELLEYKEKKMGDEIRGGSKFGTLGMLNVQIDVTNIAMKSKTFQDFLKADNKYDIIIQTYVFTEAYLGLAHHFNARVIPFMPYSGLPHINEVTGNSAPYSYVPLPLFDFTDEMSFLQRTQNTLGATFLTYVHKLYLFPQQGKILKKYFPNAPPLEQLQRERVDIVFVNGHFSSEFPRPVTPNIVYIGGFHVKEPQPLDSELKKYLDDAAEGAIFVAFGSNVPTADIPKEKIDAFVNKFAKIPQKILFKYDGILARKPKNVQTSNWYPQKGVLAHRNTQVFVSHGGKGSMTESLYYGVPTLCISFFGDQKKNCEDIEKYGYGIHLPYLEVTEESFEKAFDELTRNPKYREEAKYRSTLAQEQEMDPMDRINFWIEHIYKFKGAKHLQPKSVTMPLYQYLLLDVWGFILSILGLLLLVFYKITKFGLKLICGKKEKAGTKRKVKKN